MNVDTARSLRVAFSPTGKAPPCQERPHINLARLPRLLERENKMNFDKLNQWLLLGSHIGILGGLILVGLQIRQEGVLAEAELRAEVSALQVDVQSVVMGEAPALVLEKAAKDPAALTMAEFHVLDALLINQVASWMNTKQLSQLGVIPGNEWEAQMERADYYYFGNPAARAWWEEVKSTLDPEFVTFTEPLLRKTSPKGNVEFYDRVINRLRDEAN